MVVKKVKVEGRNALLAEMPDGYIKLVFDDGEVRIGVPSASVSKLAIDDAAHEATPQLATEDQKSAGNYKMGHIKINGVSITIENPVGSKRKPQWPTLKSHYGYIKTTEGADGEHLDCFVREGTDDSYDGPVYVIDQVKQNGAFDEHKILIGWTSKQDAVEAYSANYTPDWQVGKVTTFTWDGFKDWLKNGDHTVPVSE